MHDVLLEFSLAQPNFLYNLDEFLLNKTLLQLSHFHDDFFILFIIVVLECLSTSGNILFLLLSKLILAIKRADLENLEEVIKFDMSLLIFL